MGEVRPVCDPPERLVGVPEAARRLGRPERTVRFWCMRGWIRCTQTPGGRYRVALAEIARVLAGDPLIDDLPAARA